MAGKPRKRRSRRFIAPQFQPRGLTRVTGQAPLVVVVEKCRDAAAIWLALCQMAAQRRSLIVYPTLKVLGEISGRVTARHRNISRALRALHEGGFIELERKIIERSADPSGNPVTVLAVRLRAGDLPVLPFSLLSQNLDPKALPACGVEQTSLADLAGADWRAPAVYWAMGRMASRQGSLTVRADKVQIAAEAGLADRTGEATGQALKLLADANWIQVVRRSGRRGSTVQAGEYRIVPGQVTRAFLPIQALHRAPKPGVLVFPVQCQTPTSALEGVELKLRLSDNFDIVTSPEDWNREAPGGAAEAAGAASACASGGCSSPQTAKYGGSPSAGTDRLDLAKFPKRASETWPSAPRGEPSGIVEQFRPRILDRDLRYVFDADKPVSSRLERLDRQIEIVRQVCDESRHRADGICQMKDDPGQRGRHYRKYRQRWDLHRSRYEDWATEASDILNVACYLKTALEHSTDDRGDPKFLGVAGEARRDARRIVRCLKDRKANRRNRRIYYEGPALVWGAMDWLLHRRKPDGVFDAAFVPLNTPRPPSESVQESVPTYTPRYEEIMNGWYLDTVRNCRTNKIPGGVFNGDMEAIRKVPVIPELSRISPGFRKAMKSLATLGFRAFEELRGECAIRVVDMDSALWELAHNFVGSILERLPRVMLIASTAPVDAHRLAENLRPHAAVYKTYRQARAEYSDAPVLGMIVKMRRKLWIIHDDPDLPQAKGQPRESCQAPDGSGRWSFEPLAAFRISAKAAWGWFSEEDQPTFGVPHD